MALKIIGFVTEAYDLLQHVELFNRSEENGVLSYNSLFH